MKHQELLSQILGRDISIAQVVMLERDWNAFTKEPQKYVTPRFQLVRDMVNLYLDELYISDADAESLTTCHKNYARGLFTLDDYEQAVQEIMTVEIFDTV